jgi:23S rRNA pseudouridine2605 synthase
MKPERLQKILARGGIASRRNAEQLILDGRVRVNGRVVTELGVKADPRHDRVEVDGKRVVAEPPVYYALNKPRGYVTTMDDPEGRPSIRTLLEGHAIPARVFPVGRLDFHTSGLLLLTNDGEFSDGLLHPRKAVPKTYVVKVQGTMAPSDIERWREGVELEDGITLPADAHFLRNEAERHDDTKTWLEITIREGRNQQIRRMGEATGFPVMRLSRTSFAGISSEGLKPGELRPLHYDELVSLKKEFGVPKSPGVARDATSINESRRRLIRHVRSVKEAVLSSDRAPARGGDAGGGDRGDRAPRARAERPTMRSYDRGSAPREAGAPQPPRAPGERAERPFKSAPRRPDRPGPGAPYRGESPTAAPSRSDDRHRPAAERGAARPLAGAPRREDRPRPGAPRGEERPRTGAPRREDRPRPGAPRGEERPRTGAPQREDRPRPAAPRGEERPRAGAPRPGAPRGEGRSYGGAPRREEHPRAGAPRGEERSHAGAPRRDDRAPTGAPRASRPARPARSDAPPGAPPNARGGAKPPRRPR